MRAAYEAIAAAGERADAPDDATFVSLRDGAAAGHDDTATGRAIRAFSAELKRRTSLGEDLPTAWSGAVRHTAEAAPDPVFHTVADAVRGVLRP